MRQPLLVATLAAFLVPAAPAQWSVLDGDPSGLLSASGALLIHDDGTALRGRPVPGLEWVELGPSGTPVIGLSDHLALVGTLAAPAVWDARTGEVAPLVADPAVLARVEDELAFLVTTDGEGLSTAHAWSARTGGWTSYALGSFTPISFDVVTGDGVAAVRTPTGYVGFGAASGTWGELPADPLGDYPEAAGHVAGVRLFDPATQLGEDRYAAFSGHRGTWSVSNDLHFSSVPRFGRDSIGIRLETPIPQRYLPALFDGYRGVFQNSPVVHTDNTPIDLTFAHLHLIDDLSGGQPFYEWFTPLAQGTNTTLAGPYELLAASDDLVLWANQASPEVLGLSALLPADPVAAPLLGQAFDFGVGRAIALVGDDGGQVLAWLPLLGQWSAPLASGLPSVAVGDAGALVASAGEVHGIGANSGAWVPLGQGAASALWAANGVLAAEVGPSLWFFDARHSVWIDGGPLAAGSEIQLGVDHLVAYDPASGELRGWAAAAPGWSAAEGLVAPLAASPTSSGRLTWVFDAAGQLWVFGGGAAFEDAGRWPLELDPLLRPETAGAATARLDATLAGRAGEWAVLLVDAVASWPGLALAPIGGGLELGLSPVVLGGPFDLGASGTARVGFDLPGGLSTGLGLWLQSFLIDPATFGLAFGAGAARVELR